LKKGGVNRLSMGVQSFDDAILQTMGRPHTADQARNAWRMIRDAGFENAGIDLICGWPGCSTNSTPSEAWLRTLDTATSLSPDHCSVYTLILEPETRLARDVDAGRISLPSDDAALSELAEAERILGRAGLERYEISSFAKPGKECRHNLATWRGEDYTGIGEGACSREGNAVSRVIFRLHLIKEGFSPSAAAVDFPELATRVDEWNETLNRFTEEGLLISSLSDNDAAIYRLTPRGTEVCDTILAELI
jgi:coproporphyrinogen III oxidase-like Fe-S oxidoreductase